MAEMDLYSFKFKDIDLSGSLLSWNDAIGIRIASHLYAKRDGAEQEMMGADPGRFTMRIVLMGPQWAANYRALVASIRQEPRGIMVHPIFGTMRVACKGIPDAAIDQGRERKTVNLTLVFDEDALDQSLDVETFVSPTTAAANVSVASTALTTGTASYPAAVQTSVAGIVALGATYAAAAVTSASSNIATLGLTTQLNAIGKGTDAAMTLILAAQSTQLYAFPALSLAAQFYASIILLDSATAKQRPVQAEFIVQSPLPLTVLAGQLYPGEGRARLDELIALNPALTNPAFVPAGTKLVFAKAALA